MINSFVRKWLGVPRCLSSIALYGKGIVALPISSLTEELKCAKVRQEITLSRSKDRVVRRVAPTQLTQGGNGNQNKRFSKLSRCLGIVISWAMFSTGGGA